MFYCNNCGHIALLNRSENPSQPGEAPSVEMTCLVCNKDVVYRRIVPEDIRAANLMEFEQTSKALYELILKLQEQIEININKPEE